MRVCVCMCVCLTVHESACLSVQHTSSARLATKKAGEPLERQSGECHHTLRKQRTHRGKKEKRNRDSLEEDKKKNKATKKK